ncbi:MAG: sulfite exporter TauE/SafE family protein, partial [Phycisphaerae bacterium]|nr:sulfite exporter TauE/SafE family protein [Phycisphaerae bacterium]
MEFTWIQYASGTIIAVFVGFLTGIFGVGGGFLMTPTLMILIGVPGEIAVGTGLATILVSSSVGLWKRRGTGTVDVKLAVMLGVGSVVGVIIGILAIKRLKTMNNIIVFTREQNPMQFILLCLFFLLLTLITVFLLYDILKKSKTERHIGIFTKIATPPFIHFDSLDEPRISTLPIEILGLSAGILTGLLGIGGGIVVIPALIYLVGQRASKAVGTSLLLVWISSLAGVSLHLLDHNIKWLLLAGMAAGSTGGVWI